MLSCLRGFTADTSLTAFQGPIVCCAPQPAPMTSPVPCTAVQPSLLPALPGQLARVLPHGRGAGPTQHGLHPGQGRGHRSQLARPRHSRHCRPRVQVSSYVRQPLYVAVAYGHLCVRPASVCGLCVRRPLCVPGSVRTGFCVQPLCAAAVCSGLCVHRHLCTAETSWQ